MENKKVDTYSYKGWLNSDFFLKRVFGVVGHYLVGSMIIAIPIWIIVIIGIVVLASLFNVKEKANDFEDFVGYKEQLLKTCTGGDEEACNLYAKTLDSKE